jgi:hypothetical protein
VDPGVGRDVSLVGDGIDTAAVRRVKAKLLRVGLPVEDEDAFLAEEQPDVR